MRPMNVNKIVKEFKAFAMSGNMIEMAVGIVIGTAFGKVISALVSGIILPAVAIEYGMFINIIIDSVIIPFSIFIVIKQIKRL